MLRFKLTSNKKNKYVRINNQRFFAFKVGSLPAAFAEVTSEEPINAWLNYRGYTLISEYSLPKSYTLR
jgi:hypothetical protein